MTSRAFYAAARATEATLRPVASIGTSSHHPPLVRVARTRCVSAPRPQHMKKRARQSDSMFCTCWQGGGNVQYQMTHLPDIDPVVSSVSRGYVGNGSATNDTRWPMSGASGARSHCMLPSTEHAARHMAWCLPPGFFVCLDCFRFVFWVINL